MGARGAAGHRAAPVAALTSGMPVWELGPAQMIARVGVPGFGESRQAQDGDLLDGDDLPRAPGHLMFQEFGLVPQEVGRGLQSELAPDPRIEDGRADRLGDIVVHPGSQTTFKIAIQRIGRQCQNRQACKFGVLADFSRGLQTSMFGIWTSISTRSKGRRRNA